MIVASDKWKRRLFVSAGIIAQTLGMIGIVVPVLPTTPFLLLAAFCYLKGSPRLYNALICNRFTGTYLRDYLEGRGMPRKKKVWTITTLWIALTLTAIFATDKLVVRIILAIVAIGVTIHILRVKPRVEVMLLSSDKRGVSG